MAASGSFGDEIKSSLEVRGGARPNILMLFSDQHHAGMAGFAHSPYSHYVRTPNLDRLAAGGAVFENAYCNSPLCSPSRQSFMSGLYCHRIGVWNNTLAMPHDTVTWAHMLSLAGYETSLVGKMHFNGYQKMYGFDRRPVLEGNNDGKQFHAWGVRASHSWKAPLPYKSGRDGRGMWDELMEAGADVPERQPIFQHDLRILQGTLDLLNEKARDKSGKPWAICASFVLPHPPYRARPDILERVRGRGDLPANWRGVGRDTCDRYIQQFYGDMMNLPEGRIRAAREAYFALVEEFDEYAGRILDLLEETGQAENTIVFYFSDHGEMAGEHGLWGKVTLLESSVRVPLCVRWKGRINAGTRVQRPVSLVDLYPTFMDVAGVKLPEELDLSGHSLLPLLEKREREFVGRFVFCEFEGEGWNHPRAMLRKDAYKLVCNHSAETRLYDLSADPHEMSDLSADPKHATAFAALRAELASFWDPAAIEREVIKAQTRSRLARCKNVCGDMGW